MALSELMNIAKYSSGYNGDGPKAATPDFGFLNPDKRQATALRLLKLKAELEQAQTQAAIRKRQLDVWNSVGTPKVGDKSNAGDVTSIVDTEEVGGRDANVVNDGSDALQSMPTLPANTQSNSSLVNMMQGLQPTISTSGNLILSKPKAVKQKSTYQGVAKRYDQARTFSYAKRLADQSIIQAGKNRNDVTPEDYKVLINENIQKAEKFLYGQALSQPEAAMPKAEATDDTGIAKAVKTGMDAGLGNVPAPGEAPGAPQVPAYTDGQTAINPKTGKRLQFKGGKWQSLN